MTDQYSLITPPPELVEQWRNSPEYITGLRPMSIVSLTTDKLQDIVTQAARWGADQELEACCEYLARCAAWLPKDVQEMLDLRRPKPPSLKEQALAALEDGDIGPGASLTPGEVCIIRRALEALPND